MKYVFLWLFEYSVTDTGERKGLVKEQLMYTVYYSEYDSPHETRIGMVSAPSHMVAHRVAELQFIDSKIHKVMELTPPEEEVKFPGARFINGEFRPIL